MARVLVSGAWRPLADVFAILNHPGHSSQKSHGRRGGATGQEALDAAPSNLTTAAGRANLTPTQRRALRSYQNGGARIVNDHLRGRSDGPEPPDVARLDGIMSGSRLREDVEVYRGFDGENLFGAQDLWPTDFTGTAWRDRAFLSTTADRRYGEGAAHSDQPGGTSGVMLRLRVPKGTGGAVISGMGSEAEMLLDRGLKYTVTGDQTVREMRGPPGLQREFSTRVLDVEVSGD